MLNIETKQASNSIGNGYSQFDSISISHSILSILPYHIAVEYFTLPLNIDSKKDTATMRRGEGEQKANRFEGFSVMKDTAYFK
jgi:hypothetical protein